MCVDCELLERISSTNAFTPDALPETKVVDISGEGSGGGRGGSGSGRDRLKKLEQEEMFSGTGLWSLASYINHSCCGNATRCADAGTMRVEPRWLWRPFVPAKRPAKLYRRVALPAASLMHS